MNYKDELTKAMSVLAEDSRTIFLGQSISYPGNAIYNTLEYVPMEKRLEVPVFEDTQMGMSIGLSLGGYLPISIFPRFDFLLLAMNQLVNHLDKIMEMSNKQYFPKVIIRVAVGSTKPLYPGIQHCSDYTEGFRSLLKNTEIIKLNEAQNILPAYTYALQRNGSSLLIEVADLY